MADAAREHRDAWDTIPWVVNGTATAAERRLVDAHIAVCDDCRAERARQEALHEAVAGAAAPPADPGAEAAAEAGLARLLARIDAAGDAADEAGIDESTRRRAAGQAPPQSVRSAASPVLVRWLAAAVVVEAVAITALAVAPFVRPAYTTLAESGADAAGAAQRAAIRIVPAAEMRLDELQRVLAPLDLEVVAGPNAAGAYGLAPRGDNGTAPSRDAALAALRAAPGMRLVEPIDGSRPAR